MRAGQGKKRSRFLTKAALVAAIAVPVAVVAAAVVIVAFSDDSSVSGLSSTTTVDVNPTTTPGVATTTPATSVLSTTTSMATTSSTTTTKPEVPLTTVMGKVTSFFQAEDFAASSIPGKGLSIGPATLTIEGHGEFHIPPDTKIRRQCIEMEIVLPGVTPRPGDPCHVRADVDDEGTVHNLWVLEVSEPEGLPAEYAKLGEVVGATTSSVIVYDDVRLRDVEWPIAPGVQFFCTGFWWEPPDFPREPVPPMYYLYLDLDAGEVIRIECQGSF